MTNESFAEHLDLAERTVAYWRERPDSIPRQRTQEILDAALERASDHAKGTFARMLAVERGSGQQPAKGDIAQVGAGPAADSGQVVALIDDLVGADMADRQEVSQADWLSGTASSVITGYLFSSPTWHREEAPLTATPNAAAARIRSVAQHLMDIDFQFGGGYVRRMLLFYFQSEIAPLLRAPQQEPVRREIFGAAAEVAQLLGWSAYDAGRHGAAQRYFMQGLRLATEAADPVLGGRLLSNLSHQANYLGRYDEALQFARAAQASGAGRASSTVTAMFLAMEARALASSGDARLCARTLNLAEQAFARRDASQDPRWISYFDELELAGEAAHCFRELGRPNETQMFAARAIHLIATPARTRAFIGMVTAAGAFKAGNLDEALAHATEAVSLAGSLQSSRYLRYLTDFHGTLTERYSRKYRSSSVCAACEGKLSSSTATRSRLEWAPARRSLASNRLHTRLIFTCDVLLFIDVLHEPGSHLDLMDRTEYGESFCPRHDIVAVRLRETLVLGICPPASRLILRCGH
jgi:tetratricopeptide (TPR) repeat protein